MKENQLKIVIIFFIAVLIAPCHAESLVDSIAESHVKANVPDADKFNTYLERDLQAYFRTITKKPVTVDYEFLRVGATQTGIAYPKYYLWVKVIENKIIVKQGAVRLAAIQKQHFEVTDFLSIGEMQKNPETIFTVFPKAVGENILTRLK